LYTPYQLIEDVLKTIFKVKEELNFCKTNSLPLGLSILAGSILTIGTRAG